MPHPFREGASLPWDILSINEIVASPLNKEGVEQALAERQRLIDEGYVLTDAEKTVFTGVHMHKTLLDSLSWIQEQGLKSRAALKARGDAAEAEFKRETVGDAENDIIDFFYAFEDALPEGSTWTQEEFNAAVRGATEGLGEIADDLNIDFDEGAFAKNMQSVVEATHSESKVDPIRMTDYASVMGSILSKRELWYNQPTTTIRNNILKFTKGKRINQADINSMIKTLDEKRTSFKKWIDPDAPDSAVNELKKTLKARLIAREFNTLGKIIVVDNQEARKDGIWGGTGMVEKWLDDQIDIAVDTKFIELMKEVGDRYDYDTSAVPADLLHWLATSTEEDALYNWGKGPKEGNPTPQLGHGLAIQSFLKILIDMHETGEENGRPTGGWGGEVSKLFNK